MMEIDVKFPYTCNVIKSVSFMALPVTIFLTRCRGSPSLATILGVCMYLMTFKCFQILAHVYVSWCSKIMDPRNTCPYLIPKGDKTYVVMKR